MARRVGERDGVGRVAALDGDRAHGLAVAHQRVGLQDPAHLRLAGQDARDDRGLVLDARVVDEDLQQEAVDLRLGQRVGALGLDRVLRREDEERGRDRERLPADRHLLLLHDLQQRRLHLRGRAVDLVGEQQVAEDRAELGVERAGVRPPDARADEVRRDEVGRELHAAERPAHHLRERLDGQRLREAGDALEQDVAVGEQRDEHALEHRVLADDHALGLVEDLLQRGGGLQRGVAVGRGRGDGDRRRPRRLGGREERGGSSRDRSCGGSSCRRGVG